MIFFNLESWEILQDNKNLAFQLIQSRRNFFTIFIKDLESKKIYQHTLKRSPAILSGQVIIKLFLLLNKTPKL